MFRGLFSRWFKPAPVTEPEVEIPDEALFLNGRDGVSGPHIHGLARDWADTQKACQIRGCERPSAFDVVTLQHLDVDIPFRDAQRKKLKDYSRPRKVEDDFIETQGNPLPTYQWYALCDRHYRNFVRGKAPNGEATKLVIGPYL